jgi:hypothetical protein
MKISRMMMTLAFLPACESDDGMEPGDGTTPDECSVLSRDMQAGDLFDVYAFGHDFSPFCSAGFDTAQAHAQWVAEAWGEPPNPFDYMLFESREEPCWPCRSGLLGCAFATSMAATDLPERHEIAHAIRRTPCPALLEEGWATLYGSHFWDAETGGDLRQAADSVEQSYLPGEFYPLATRFVAFLLETRGLDGLKELCGLPISDADSLDLALNQVFEQSLDEISAEFNNYPTWSLGQLRQDQSCDGTEITSSPGAWSMNLECGAAAVEGRDGGQLIAQHLIELPQAGNYQLTFDSPVDFHVRLELRSCAREGMASTIYQIRHVYGYGTVEDVLFMDMPAGVYVVRLMLEDSAEPLAVNIAVGPWP